MPTYTVTPANLTLSSEQKAKIAALITEAHSGATGAPSYFAQVIFTPLDAGSHFIGGRPNNTPHLYILGLIRAGRTTEVKRALMSRILDGVHATAGVGAEDVWIYLQDIEADHMIEFGRFLPQPGAERAWQSGLSANKLREQGRLDEAVIKPPPRH
jgi:phenylpyruvate tautomerase PptA (4-oxalocrotonate tautomerase family)